MLSVEDWAEIRRLHRAEKMPVKVIARVMKVSRNTVRAAIASDRPPKYQRPAKGSIVDAAELRPAYLPPDPASRTAYEPGEIAQCDLWFPPVSVPVGFGQVRKPTQLPVLTMVTGYARWLAALLIPSRTAADLFAGWWQLISGLGAVPRVLVWDAAHGQ